MNIVECKRSRFVNVFINRQQHPTRLFVPFVGRECDSGRAHATIATFAPPICIVNYDDFVCHAQSYRNPFGEKRVSEPLISFHALGFWKVRAI